MTLIGAVCSKDGGYLGFLDFDAECNLVFPYGRDTLLLT